MEKQLSNKEKLVLVTSKGIKVLNILRKICIAVLIILAVVGTGCFVLGIIAEADAEFGMQLIENKVISGHDIGGDFSKFMGEELSVEEIAERGKIAELLFYVTLKIFSALVSTVLALIVCKFFIKIFTKINEKETPFSNDLVGDFKAVFILVSIIAILCNVLVGIVIGFFMLCLFFIYKHGCELQQESDETL